jgi:hypothetical protein
MRHNLVFFMAPPRKLIHRPPPHKNGTSIEVDGEERSCSLAKGRGGTKYHYKTSETRQDELEC